MKKSLKFRFQTNKNKQHFSLKVRLKDLHFMISLYVNHRLKRQKHIRFDSGRVKSSLSGSPSLKFRAKLIM